MATTEAQQFRKKPVVITASQWFKNGDHPEDYVEDIAEHGGPRWTAAYQREHDWEGQMVRRYRHPDYAGESLCEQCGQQLDVHGWIDTLEQGHRVCPADWIITGVAGEKYPCKPDIFEATYVRCQPNQALPDDVLAEVDPAQLLKRLHAAEQELTRYRLTEITTAELEQTRHDIDKAQTLVGALAAGDARWRMSIPADRERDSDLILTKALDAGEKATRQWQNALSQLQEIKSASSKNQKAGPVSRVFETWEQLHTYAENGHFNGLALLREADGRAWLYFEGKDGPMCIRPWDDDEEAVTRAKAGTLAVACFAEPDDFTYPVTVTVDYYAPEAPGV